MLNTRIEPEECPSTRLQQPQKPIKIAIVQHDGYATIRFSQSSRLLFEADLAPAVAAYLCEALASALATMVATMTHEITAAEAADLAATELRMAASGTVSGTVPQKAL
jgi:hypothetical protein